MHMLRTPGGRALAHTARGSRYKMASHTVLLLLLLVSAHGSQACSNVTLASTQLDALLAEYDREAPPGTLTHVAIALDVRHLDVDEGSSMVRLVVDMGMMWQEPRISWNASEWGCERLVTSAERVWAPDVSLLNGAADAAADDAPRVVLGSDGAVTWLASLALSVSLSLHLEAWPRDSHTASFRFGSRLHTADELQLEPKDMGMSIMADASSAWQVSLVSETQERQQDAAEAASARDVVSLTLTLRRHAPAHALCAGAVLSAALLLLLAAALLPPASRAPLCACAALTAALWLMSSLSRVAGAGGVSAPRVWWLAGALCACGGLAAVGAALVTRLSGPWGPHGAQGGQGGLSRAPPRRLHALADYVSTLFNLEPVEVRGADASGASGAADALRGPWSSVARLMDVLLQTVLALTLLVFVCLCL